MNTYSHSSRLRNRALVEIYSDGSGSEQGPGGYGAALRYGASEKELSGFELATTSQRMELSAICALESLKKPCRARLVSDSQYLIRGMSEWMPGWIKAGRLETPDRSRTRPLDQIARGRQATRRCLGMGEGTQRKPFQRKSRCSRRKGRPSRRRRSCARNSRLLLMSRFDDNRMWRKRRNNRHPSFLPRMSPRRQQRRRLRFSSRRKTDSWFFSEARMRWRRRDSLQTEKSAISGSFFKNPWVRAFAARGRIEFSDRLQVDAILEWNWCQGKISRGNYS